MANLKYKRIILSIIAYILLTIILFDLGPVKYELLNPLRLHIFIFALIISLYCGFNVFLKIKRKASDDTEEKIRSINDIKIQKILKTGVYIYAAISLIMALNSTNETSLIGYVIKVIQGMTNPAASYYEKVNNQIFYSQTLNMITVFLSPFVLLIQVLGVSYFSSLNKIQKTAFIIGMLFNITQWLALGTNKGIFDIVILLISCYIIKKIAPAKTTKTKIKRKNSIRQKALIIISLIAAFSIFTYFISNRMYIQLGNGLDKVNYGVTKIINYVTQGYKGLDYAMELEWEPTYGVGNSVFLTKQVDSIFGTTLSLRTYQKRAEQFGWSSTVNWHTAYSWFANDLSFPGVIIFMFFVGAYLASILKSIEKYRDYYSMGILYLLTMGFFYSSANNQVLSFANTLIAFIVLCAARLIRQMALLKGDKNGR